MHAEGGPGALELQRGANHQLTGCLGRLLVILIERPGHHRRAEVLKELRKGAPSALRHRAQDARIEAQGTPGGGHLDAGWRR